MLASVIDDSIGNIPPDIRMHLKFICRGCIYIDLGHHRIDAFQPHFNDLESAVRYSIRFCHLVHCVKTAELLPEVYNPGGQFTANTGERDKFSSICGIDIDYPATVAVNRGC